MSLAELAHHRKELAVASIVNLRGEFEASASETFGQFLTSLRVSHPVPAGIELPELTREIHVQTARIKEQKLYLQTLLVILALLAERREYGDFDSIVAELQRLPRLLVDAKAAFESTAVKLAEAIKDETYHIFTGAGSVWPEAYYYAMCILEEMQWIRTRPVHAADFFHGTLELVEQGVVWRLRRGTGGEDGAAQQCGDGGVTHKESPGVRGSEERRAQDSNL